MNLQQQAKELLLKMTVEEKAGLCSGGDFWHTMAVERVGLPKIMLTDGPHGLRRQAGEADHLGLNKSVPSTCFPAGATSACSWDIELMAQIGEKIGTEAYCEGVQVVLGPAINIKRNPLCGRNFEYFSEDPYLAGKLATAYIKGMQQTGVAACPKHFAANNQERLRMTINSVIDERALHEIYLTPFEYAVKEGKAKTIMSSYNRLNGDYTNENKHLLKDILRTQWGFDGVVVSDWGGCNDRLAGLLCDNQLEMPGSCGETDREILQAVKSGALSQEKLDEILLPLVCLILDTTKNQTPKSYSVEQHHNFARHVAQQSIVLLKNEGNILPLKQNETVAVIGDFAQTARYQGAGSSIINPTKLEVPLDELKKMPINVIGFEQGFKRYGEKNNKLLQKAVELAKKAEKAVLFLGLDERSEIEGLDRENILLPKAQLDLFNAVYEVNKNIIIVLSGGSPVDLRQCIKAKAILAGYLGGQAAGSAIANLLCGKENPSGKLAETFAIKYNDLPNANYYLNGDIHTEYRESIFVGYRYFEKAKASVQFPFGHGLSYTTFEYSNILINENVVSLTVKNTGNLDGSEIVQLYIKAENSNLPRPEKELKGFAKVHLAANESKQVNIELDEKAFAFYNAQQGRWQIEAGKYSVIVGASSADIRLSLIVEKEGVTLNSNEKELPSYYSAQIKNVPDEEYATLLGKPLQQKYWNKTQPLNINSSLKESALHKGTGRLIYRIGKLLQWVTRNNVYKNAAVKAAYDMPYRSLSRMTDGVFTMAMAQALVDMTNKGFWHGGKKFLKAFKAKKQTNIGGIKNDKAGKTTASNSN